MEIEMQMPMSTGASAKIEVADCLADTMGNAVVLYFKAHGHHWNVKGMHFSMFHDFFAMIAADVYGSLDDIAENILKLDVGRNAPYRLVEFARLTSMDDAEVGNEPAAMLADLFAANTIMLQSLNECFAAATAANCQAIANFIASRLDMHEKWDWQLKSYMTQTEGM
jgi:starvation-inducible DNA-binding protein